MVGWASGHDASSRCAAHATPPRPKRRAPPTGAGGPDSADGEACPELAVPHRPEVAIRSRSRRRSPKPPKLDDEELLDDSRQRPEIHAGAHQRSRSTRPTGIRTITSRCPTSSRKGRKPDGHGLRLLPHAHRPGTPGEFRARRTARGLYKGAARAFRSGSAQARRARSVHAQPRHASVAAALTDEEIDESAKYFAQQKLRPARVRDREPAHPARRARGLGLQGSRRHRRSRGPPARGRARHRAPRASRRSHAIHRLRAARRTGARQAAGRPPAKGQDPDLRHLPSRRISRAPTRFRRSPAARLPTCCGSCSRSRTARAATKPRSR